MIDLNEMSEIKYFLYLTEVCSKIPAHPNCVLFVTHGGLLSITESVHFGVPIVGLPAFGDQFMNVKVAASNGFAKEVKISLTMGDELLQAIKEVTKDPRFTN